MYMDAKENLFYPYNNNDLNIVNKNLLYNSVDTKSLSSHIFFFCSKIIIFYLYELIQ